MSTIDDRIVNMQFNNDQFQAGITDTNKSLIDLQNNLKLDGATSGLSSIQNAADRMNLGTIAQGVESISNAFSVLGIVGINILSNITQSAFNAGKRIAGAILDPIMEGGSRRALALEQAKFQFRGLGLDIEATMAASLQAVLGTAYGLDDAATAAAQFGASGITAGNGLYETLRSIAGVAAQTGSSYGDIARIFQGIAGNGRVYGNDLLSLASRGVNAAALLAKSMGTSEEAVRKMVSEGKISFKQFSDVMLTTFGDNATKANETFTGALSNMKAALSRIGANSATPYFESLRIVMNALTPVIDQVKNAIAPLQEIIGQFQNKVAGGLATFLAGVNITQFEVPIRVFGESLLIIFNIVQKLAGAIGSGFNAIFPAPTVSQVLNIAFALKTFLTNLKPTGAALINLQQASKGFFAIFSIAFQIIGAVVKVLMNLLGTTDLLGGGFGDLANRVGDWLVSIDAALKSGDGLAKFFGAIGEIIAVPIKLIQTFFGILADGWTFLTNPGAAQFQNFLSDTGERFGELAKVGEFFKGIWNGIVVVANAVWSVLKPIFSAIGSAVAELGNGIKDLFGELDFNNAIAGLNGGLFITMVAALLGNFKNVINSVGGGLVTQMSLIFGGLQTNLKALEMNTNAKTLKEIAISVALLAGSALLLSLVDSGKMIAASLAIVGMMKAIMLALAEMTAMTGAKGIFDMVVLAGVLIAVANAIFILAAAVALLSLLPIEKMAGGLAAVVVLLVALTLTLSVVADIMAKSGPGILAGAAAMILMAQAVLILVASVVALAFIPLANLAQGLGGVIVLLGALVGVVAILGQIMKSNAAGIIIGAAAMLLIGSAVLRLAGAVAILSLINMDNMVKALVALAVTIAILLVAVRLMGHPITLVGAAAMLIIAFAVTVLAGALKIVATMSWDDIGRSMVVLAGSLAILALAAYAFTGAAVGAVALLVVAAALMVLVPSLKLLGTLKWDALGTGLGILAAGLGILAVMGLLLIPASVGFLLLGVAILALGTGVYLAAAGVAALAIGIGLLVTVGGAGIALFTQGIQAFAAQIPLLAVAIGNGMVAMAVTIGQSAPKLVGAFVSLLMAMLAAIGTVVPEIIRVATLIVVSLVEALVILVPLLVDAGLKIIVGLLKGIADNIGGIVEQGANIIINFINAMAAKLPDIIAAGGNMVLSFINGISDYINENTAKFTTAGTKLFNAIVDGITAAIKAGGSALKSAGKKIGEALLDAAKDALGIASPSKEFKKVAAYSIEGLTIGLAAGSKDIDKAGTLVGKTAVDSVTKSMSNIANAVSNNMDVTPTIRPVLDLSGVKKDASQISGMLGAKTISLENTTANANYANSGYEENMRAATDADGEIVNTGTVLNLTQNNYSPKNISEVETYRNTKNLMAVKKGELDK